MGMIEDIRKLLQDLVTPEFKSLQTQVKANDEASKLRDEALSAKMDMLAKSVDSKFELVLNRMDAQHAMVINSLNIDKRVEVIERQIMPAARTS
ncbi:MAG: hypothetical protein M3R43_04195 [Acidobacteriota bacterium]|nr:hypothetical protein [Acidobacteriota bacterium]